MTIKNRNTITLISILVLLTLVTTFLVVAFTFAGNPQAPDCVITYTMNNLSWNIPTDANGVGDMNIFGDPDSGGQYPLIHPESGGNYYLRLKNDVHGKIGYRLYFYTDNTNEIPLKFDIPLDSTMSADAPITSELEGKQIVSKFAGEVNSQSLKDFQINWYWDSASDVADTRLGTSAATEDMLYTIKVMLIVEDNNFYGRYVGVSGARLLHRSFISGYPDNTFRPENNMSRAEVSAIFARILSDYNESALADTNTGFADVPADMWSARYIARLADSKIITGYQDGTFKPDNPITRAEFAAICVRFYEGRAEEIKGKDAGYTDVSDDHWAMEYINKASAKGFMTGYPDGSFGPDKNVTRAEVVTVINRMLNRYPDKEYIDRYSKKLNKYTDVKDKKYWAYYQIIEASHEHNTMVGDGKEGWSSVR